MPAVILTELAGTLSAFANKDSTAALALPFSGGTETLTFSISPSQPAISERDAPGTTFNFNVIEALALAQSVFSLEVFIKVRLTPAEIRFYGQD